MPSKLPGILIPSFFLLLFLLLFSPVIPHTFVPFAQAAYRDDFPDFEGKLIDQNETWYKNQPYVFDKEIRIVDGAKLTIEPGTHISFKRDQNGSAISFGIFDGLVEAIGTEAEPIVFQRASDEDAFSIQFSDANEEQISVFQYVHFLKGGDEWDVEECLDCQQSFLENFFVHRAIAAQKAGIAALQYWEGRLRIEDSVFMDSVFSDVWAYDSRFNDYTDEEGNFWPDPSLLLIRNSDFSGNTVVPAIHIEDFSCQNFSPFCRRKIIFGNNWYSSPSGPSIASNSTGTGKQIANAINLNDWSSKPFFCLENCYSNVLFLPGLEASRLYDDSESSCIADKIDPTRAWEPSCNDDARKLYLGENGKSLDTDIHTKDGDVLDETPVGANIYKSFIAKMDTMKDVNHLINDWKPVAYDWRLSFDDILDDGVIADTLRSLAQNSKTKKVTIVAHSNGGLLAKALLQKLGDEEAKGLVDKIVFVAVPQVGTPSAIAGMLHGYKQNFFPILDTKTARGLAENMPGAYQLLPSEKYFSSVDTPAVTFDTADSPDWKDRYSDPIRSQNRLHDFLADTYRRVAATDSDTDTPSKLNDGLLNKAEDSHAALDDWTAPDGVKVMQIAGWGVPATLSSIEYDTRKFCDASTCSSLVDLLNPNFDFTLDGDGTVVTPSSLWMSGAERYWVDLKKYNRFVNRLSDGRFLEIDHKDILEISELNAFIVDSIVNNTQPLADYAYLSTEVPSFGNEKRLQYSLHSPLTLDLYDDEGRHTGVTSDGSIEEQIPGTYYRQFGDVKYIFADESSPLHISLSGYDTGTFTFAIKELEGDTPLGTVTFQDMPTTPQTEVTFDISSDLENASDLHIDKDGDGTVDFQLQPKIGEVVTFDITPPTTTASLSGMRGTNDWHTGDVTVTLSSTDNENGSGIEKTEYSLDNGETWNLYAESLVTSQEGTTAIQYFSTDKQGNKEAIQTETIRIDKTAPEANIVFNPSTQKLDITGTDNLSQDVSVVTTESSVISAPEPGSRKIKSWFSDWFHKGKNREILVTATLTDEAGHKTDIVFEKKKDKERRIDLSLQSISYDSETTLLSKTLLQYKWRLDWKRKYHLFASQLRTDSTDIESHYIPKKNETWIMERPRELADDDNDDDSEHRPIRTKLSGMVIPSMMTEKGMMRIIY